MNTQKSHIQRTNVYIQIEDELRETYAKVYLACKLADAGYRVFVMKDYLLPNFSWPEGIIIGKNNIHLAKLRKKTGRNYSFILLEEEGADAIGDLDRRINKVYGRVQPTVSENQANVITQWGKWQANAVEKFFNVKARVTGSLYLEVCKAKHQNDMRGINNFWTKGYSDYVLINTRFSLLNCNYAPHVSVANKNPDFAYDRSTPDYWRNLAANQMLMLGSFVPLITRICQEFKDRQIILRPHPGENIEFYQELFKDFSNIQIIKEGFVLFWIRNARCIVMNGCTTSLQAELAKKPVINFVPPYNVPIVDFSLFDEIGRKEETIEGVIQAVHKAYEDEMSGFKIGEWKDIEQTFSIDIDFFEEMMAIVNEQSEAVQKYSSQKFGTAIERIKNKTKTLIKMVIRRPHRGDDKDLHNFGKYFLDIKAGLKSNVQYRKLMQNCFCVESESEGVGFRK